MHAYSELFERNSGIFTDAEQERLRTARILIIGCGGIGGTVAVILARTGVENFILIEPDCYEASNMNRQICCFESTIGVNKALAIKEHISRINPAVSVEVHDRMLTHEEIRPLIMKSDIVFPAADDFAFSLIVFRDAKRLGRPALFAVPSGTWANVSMIMPDGLGVEDIEGVPRLETYEALKEMFNTPRYRFGTYFYVPVASWRIDHYSSFIYEGAPPAQLCPTVWTCSSIGAIEVVKAITLRWKVVASPRYYFITHNRIRIQRINGFSLTTLMVWQRKLMYALFQTPFGPVLEIGQRLWWRAFRKLYRRVERTRNGRV